MRLRSNGKRLPLLIVSYALVGAWSLLRRRRPPAPADEQTDGPGAARGAVPADRGVRERPEALFAAIGMAGATGGALVVLLAIALLLDQWKQDESVSLDALLPEPGTKVKLWELAPAPNAAPIDAELRGLAIRPGSVHGVDRPHAIDLEIPVSASGCAELTRRLGGGCGGRPADRIENPASVALRSRAAPVRAIVSPGEGGWLEMGHSEIQLRQAPPAEWSIAAATASSAIRIECVKPTPLLIAAQSSVARVDCAPDERAYTLRLVHADRLPTYFLNGVHALHADLDGRAAAATVGGGTLTVGDDASTVRDRSPKRIRIGAADSELVTVGLDAPAVNDTASFSISSDEASELRAAYGELPSWLERHGAPGGVVLNAIAGLFVAAAFTLLVALWRRS